MDLLEGWLGQYVHQALTEALRWKIQASQRPEPVEHPRFEDDGSNLRVKSMGKFLVQITKIVQATSPIQVFISDSKTHVQVTIATAAAEQFQRAHRKRITEGTLGAIFQLTDFETTVEYYGPRRTTVSMLIHELNHIGSDGSSAFGSPRPIECLQDIKTVLTELQAFSTRDRKSTKTDRDRLATSHVLSHQYRSGSSPSSEPGEDLSQAAFATQAPRLLPGKPSRFGTHGRMTSGAIVDQAANTEKLNDSGNIVDSEGSISGQRAAGNGARATAKMIGEIEPHSLIESRSNGNGSGNVRRKSGKEGAEVHIRQSTNIDAFEKQKMNLLNLLGGKPTFKAIEVQQFAPTDGAGANQKIAIPEQPTSKSKTDTEVATSEVAQLQDPPGHGIEVSVHPGHDVPDASGVPAIIEKHPLGSVRRTIRPSKGITKQRTTPKRIRLKEVRIPKNQKDLLERSDAWLPPEPGYRAPSANVPIEVLQELNKRADQKKEVHLKSLQNTDSPKTSDHSSETAEENDQDQGHLTDSDEPIPDSQWPPSSPEQPSLPPDSSAEAAQRPINTETQILSNEDRLAHNDVKISSGSTHRSSGASLLSDSDMSNRRNPFREAKESQILSEFSSSSDSLSRKYPYRTTRSHLNYKDVSLRSQRSKRNRIKARNHDIGSSEEKSDGSKSHKTGKSKELKLASVDSSLCKEQGHVTPASAETTKVIETHVSAQIKHPEEHTSESTSRTDLDIEQLKTSSPLASDSDSELETTVPHGLAKTHGSLDEACASPPPPSTALQVSIPITQVKQTPYINGYSNNGLKSSVSPVENREKPLPTFSNELTSHAIQSETIDIESSSAEVGVTDAADDVGFKRHCIENGKKVLVKAGEAGQSSSVNDKPENSAKESCSMVSTADDAISSIEETVLPLSMSEIPQVLSTQTVIMANSFNRQPTDLKRKATEPLGLSSDVSKRRKPFLARATSDVVYSSNSQQELAMLRWRKERLAYHRKDNEIELNDGTSSTRSRSPASESTAGVGQHSRRVTTHQHNTGHCGQEIEARKMPPSRAETENNITASPTSNTDRQEFSTLYDTSKPVSSPDGEILGKAHQPTLQSSSETGEERPSPPSKDGSKDLHSSSSVRHTHVLAQHPLLEGSAHGTEHSKGKKTKVEKSSCASASPNNETRISNPVQVPLLNEGVTIETLHGPILVQATGDTTPESGSDFRTVGLPPAVVRPSSPEKPPSLFSHFKAVYADYPGNEFQFEKICGKIANLLKADRMEHPSLWDDFIIRHRNEYLKYTSQCMEDAVDPDPYERFYRNNIEEPKYTKRVVTPKTLYEVVRSPQPASALEIPQLPHVLERNNRIGPDTNKQFDTEAAETGNTSKFVRRKSQDSERRDCSRTGDASRVTLGRPSSKQDFSETLVCDDRYNSDSKFYNAQHIPPIRSRNVNPMNGDIKSLGGKLSDAIAGADDSSAVRVKQEVIDLTEDNRKDRPVAAMKAVSPATPSSRESRRLLPWPTSRKDGKPSSLHKAGSSMEVPISSPLHSYTKQQVFGGSKSVQSPTPVNTFKDFHNSRNDGKRPPMSPPIAKHQASTLKRPIEVQSEHRSGSRSLQDGHRETKKDDLPYRAFKRNYESITPGRGNTYAEKKPVANGSHISSRSSPAKMAGNPYQHNPFNLVL